MRNVRDTERGRVRPLPNGRTGQVRRITKCQWPVMMRRTVRAWVARPGPASVTPFETLISSAGCADQRGNTAASHGRINVFHIGASFLKTPCERYCLNALFRPAAVGLKNGIHSSTLRNALRGSIGSHKRSSWLVPKRVVCRQPGDAWEYRSWRSSNNPYHAIATGLPVRALSASAGICKSLCVFLGEKIGSNIGPIGDACIRAVFFFDCRVKISVGRVHFLCQQKFIDRRWPRIGKATARSRLCKDTSVLKDGLRPRTGKARARRRRTAFRAL
jgi:hypothetical protein